jgi:serine/threonine protein kinase
MLPAAEGKYAILAELGRGGMATAYLASMRGPGGFNKLVVVKRLRASLAAEPEFLKMFLEEARLSARIDHPNVVHTTEVGFDGKYHYIAMEYLDGQSFESVSRRLLKKAKAAHSEGPPSDMGGEASIPLKFHLHVISQMLLGLDCAHELKDFDGTPLNVVHRDVSPHNVVITYDGHVKLLDFGIAKAADSSGDTRTGVMKGKCAYMPAEQFGGRQIDRRADIFAVGVILWQALTGRRLWRGMSDAEIFQKVAAGDIRTPTSLVPDLSPELEAICMKALAHKADDRYSTAAELQLALEEHINQHPELRTTSRDLGKFIGDLFEDDRARMKGIIEAQLGKAGSKSSTSIPILEGAHSYSGIGSSDMSASLYAAHGELVGDSPSPGGTRKPHLLAAVVLAAGAIAVLATFAIVRARSRANSAASPALVATVPALATESLPPTTLIHVRCTPANARLSFDGSPLDGNPATSTFRRDAVSHRVQAEAPGYLTKSELVTLNGDQLTVDLELDPVRVATPDAGRMASGRPLWTPPRRQQPQPDTPPLVRPPSPPTSSAVIPTDTRPLSHSPQLDKTDPWAPSNH